MSYVKPLAAVCSIGIYLYATGAYTRYRDQLSLIVESQKKEIFFTQIEKMGKSVTSKKYHISIGLLVMMILISTAGVNPRYGSETLRYINISSVLYSFFLGMLMSVYYAWAHLIHETTRDRGIFTREYYSDNVSSINRMAIIGRRGHKLVIYLSLVTIIYIQIAIISIFQAMHDTGMTIYDPFFIVAVMWIFFALTFLSFFVLSTIYQIYRYVALKKGDHITLLFKKYDDMLTAGQITDANNISVMIKDINNITAQFISTKELLYTILVLGASACLNIGLYYFYLGTPPPIINIP